MKYLLLIIAIPVMMSCLQDSSSDDINNTQPGGSVEWYMTKADETVLLQKQPSIAFTAKTNSTGTITINPSKTYQTVDGFGYALTGGSAYVINKLDATTKNNLLNELFGNSETSISVSYLRISIGASDLDAATFSYDDMPAGKTDTALEHFSISKDITDLIPLLKQIITINPSIKIMGSPWSPPAWMKSNDSTKGGSLLPQYYHVYANYLVKYIQAMKQQGITINTITPQNEPLHPGNNPSLLLPATDEAVFIKDHLGPAFKAAGITTKIIVYDHNCDKPEYPLTILNDEAAAKYVDGSAFHLYAGEVTALSRVHNAHPDKNVYFTEQWTGSKSAFSEDLMWHIKNVIIGTMNNWSKVALEWNLASDENYEPHTPGGCTECKGALTITGNNIKKNPSYYIVAHASKFVSTGSVRIESSQVNGLTNVAFKTPDGKTVLLVLNDGASAADFNIQFNKQTASTTLPAGSVATYTW